MNRIDKKRIQVASLAALLPGNKNWFFDYVANTIYMADNPASYEYHFTHPKITKDGLKSVKRFYILHSEYEDGEKILSDVIHRLEFLQASTVKDIEKVDDYLRSLYGYYNAFPYRRGTSAIGKVFFSGVYRGIFQRRPLFMEDGIDILAMVMTEKDFIERYRTLITLQISP